MLPKELILEVDDKFFPEAINPFPESFFGTKNSYRHYGGNNAFYKSIERQDNNIEHLYYMSNIDYFYLINQITKDREYRVSLHYQRSKETKVPISERDRLMQEKMPEIKYDYDEEIGEYKLVTFHKDIISKSSQLFLVYQN